MFGRTTLDCLDSSRPLQTKRPIHTPPCWTWGRIGIRAVPALITSMVLLVPLAAPVSAANLVHEIREVEAPQGAKNLCNRYAWACDRSSAAKVRNTDAQIDLAARVNLTVNRAVREVADLRQYGKEELWSLPTDRGGDCEDFALLKKLELIRRGLAPANLSIATALDPRRNAHAVLVLRTDRGDFVLDNLTNRMKPWQATGYSFLRMQDPNTKSGWTAVMRGGIFTS